MSIWAIILIAVGLAMDCFTVSLSTGISVRKWRNEVLLMALLFGLFQGGMPLISFAAGIRFAEQIKEYDHWIALLLLSFIGGKMIWESLRGGEDTQAIDGVFAVSRMLTLALATSIDALATGIIFVPTPELIWLAAGVIALVSFLFSVGGYLIGMEFGKRFRLNMNLIGGIILVALGVKIFVEHMWLQ